VAEGSDLTVVVAGAANLAIAVAKGIAGVLSGSAALLSESAHSVADTLNQVFLLTALRRSRKPADGRHPFGYGMERYFWSLLAAVGIFVLGAGFSVAQGIRAIVHPEPLGSLPIAYAVLVISFVFEGVSWLRAVRQLRREAAEHDVGTAQHLREHAEPAVKTVAFEDSAALAGLVLAAIGITVDAVTGSGLGDGIASIVIGCLLVVVAWSLGRESKAMLIGRALPDDVEEEIRRTVLSVDGIDDVVELLTLRLSPEDVLVAARADLHEGGTTGDAVERLGDEVEERVRKEFPMVRHLFLDPTPPGPRGVQR
jgi:cation diffusion facilitator family transporter